MAVRIDNSYAQPQKQQEGLSARVQSALKMSGICAMAAKGPFEQVCNDLKNCMVHGILVALPVILQGLESDDFREQSNASYLLDTLAKNSDIKDALSIFLSSQDFSICLGSTDVLTPFCQFLVERGMYYECVQLLIKASQSVNLDVKSTACYCLSELIRKFPGQDALLGNHMFATAVNCLQSPDTQFLAVRYFAALFDDKYFERNEIPNDQLVEVITLAQMMWLSKDVTTRSVGIHFFEKFISCASPQQFALLPQDYVSAWADYAHAHQTWEVILHPLAERQQQRAAELAIVSA